jgi:hypothetical protein
MALVTNGLVNQLDASVLLLSGFSNNQTLLDAFIPDQVNSKPWYGSAGYSMYVAASASPASNKPVIRLFTGNLSPGNFNDYLNYDSMTVLIAAKRTGPSYNNLWQGLFSLPFNNTGKGVRGVTLLSITNNNNVGGFNNWGTYGNTVTTATTSAMNINTPYVIGMSVNPDTSGTFYTNTSATGTFTSTKAQGYYGIGGLESGDGFFAGDIYEVLIYSRVLTYSEVSASSNYLIGKWFA